MQLLHGQSLSEKLTRETQLPIADVCRITRETAEGLAAAHDKGLMHRDIKPENIWLEENRRTLSGRAAAAVEDENDRSAHRVNDDYRVKILDFGLARTADEQTSLTQTGAVVGTPSYLAPEQARGLSVDSRADLFSLGVVMYQMLTGTKPFQRVNTLATLRAIDSDTPSSPSEIRDDVPPELSDLVMQLLEKNPDQRLQTAHEVVVAVESIENGSLM